MKIVDRIRESESSESDESLILVFPSFLCEEKGEERSETVVSFVGFKISFRFSIFLLHDLRLNGGG